MRDIMETAALIMEFPDDHPDLRMIQMTFCFCSFGYVFCSSVPPFVLVVIARGRCSPTNSCTVSWCAPISGEPGRMALPRDSDRNTSADRSHRIYSRVLPEIAAESAGTW